MQIKINTDHNIDGHEALADHVRNVVTHTLNRLSTHITRIEVHLSDENGHKRGQGDKCCVMEARLEGYPPIAVTHHGDTLHKSASGAAEKLARMIDGTLGRLRDQKTRCDGLPEPTLPEE
ncbi:MAG: HPF/RaiA family ribosome-associated protein [Formivibrio sp.]|nr:HPF/RaiA family ribosome-associated protein [Formivibrio sp.]